MASPLGAPILTIPATRGWGSSIELQYKQIITYSNNNLNQSIQERIYIAAIYSFLCSQFIQQSKIVNAGH